MNIEQTVTSSIYIIIISLFLFSHIPTVTDRMMTTPNLYAISIKSIKNVQTCKRANEFVIVAHLLLPHKRLLSA